MLQFRESQNRDISKISMSSIHFIWLKQDSIKTFKLNFIKLVGNV